VSRRPAESPSNRQRRSASPGLETPNSLGERVADEWYAKASIHHDDDKTLWMLTPAIGQIFFVVGEP
jgi:hypothetical protein